VLENLQTHPGRLTDTHNSRCDAIVPMHALYQLVDERHSSAVNDVLRFRGKVSKENFVRVRAPVDVASTNSNAARPSREQHKKEHGC
jgi:hypothetical protein